MTDVPGTEWQRRKRMPLALHVSGAATLAIGALLGRYLLHLAPLGQNRPVSILQLLVSILMLACASLGSALLILGPRLFDKVRVSARWMEKTP